MLEIERTYCSSNSKSKIIFVVLCSPKKIPGPLKHGGASTCARCGSDWFSKYIQLMILFWIQGLLSTTVYVSTSVVNASPCVEKLGVFELSVYFVQKSSHVFNCCFISQDSREQVQINHENLRGHHYRDINSTGSKLLSFFMLDFKIYYYEICSFNCLILKYIALFDFKFLKST